MEALANFVSFLKKSKLLSENFNIKKNLSSRFYVQKYVYLAKHFGLDLGYNYNLYVKGPYSSDLALDYYSDNFQTTVDVKNIFPGFRQEEYLKLVSGKTEHWLELGTTLIFFNVRNPGKSLEDYVEFTKLAKPWASESTIMVIATELRGLGLLEVV